MMQKIYFGSRGHTFNLVLLFAVAALGFFGAPGVSLSQTAGASSTGTKPRALLVPHQEAVLSMEIPGRITKITVKEGDYFKRGQILATLDCTIHRAERQRSEAEMRVAESAFAIQKRLQKLNSGSVLDLNLAQSKVSIAASDLSIRKATVRMCRIAAPFSGLVAARLASPHQNIQPGEPILEIYNVAKWEAHVIVPSVWLRWLKPGHEFTVHLEETGGAHQARVAKIGGRVDPASQTVKVIAILKGKFRHLRAGMSGTADLGGDLGGKTP
ncbi:MAG: efflux RND transporter periplasmic adaptor subunit [Rhodospirillaceae bacterium]|jgi:membrane fusion protein, multidrug efflux system|nr:efflux RND transporter periplasmic adaptor subunit [Rhodospirillaceae bacterium]MBT5195769.1 efflux RND transporter periplasmic adaptor subunit [Rhodospirillaceae bacterium]MBT6428861.1 efflux RND transporter periplasmic adaptor subunit [Rhodospirillaceae bacterium]MBT7759346.1 efflux RND transporter periplasmic adaptor subunit [Rhodospirillaceae bacterium]